MFYPIPDVSGVLQVKISKYLFLPFNFTDSIFTNFTFSICSGPSRFDWDHNDQAWVYRRTKADLLKLLESELQQLCGEPVNLS